MISKWKWDRVMMDFVSGLPLSSKKKDVIWVVMLDCAGCLFRLFQIEIQGLRRDFGRSCKKF
ncbi:Retrotransposon protein, Ty3-gypsy subclass [Gossypium australe]|uniref:Retrotransposon protein, Ty3-gypsy subclass n=1 Tax=Gossypium australe TaxID=47621 RepID=A0A5B6WGD4_9ROSI|nr:Retrotransposon protein, Ty3-gypsy subclass [Gossypium australe]